MHKTPNARMTAARTRLLLDYPWFGSLAMRLQVIESHEIPTFATDGTKLAYNPDFLESLNDAELTGVIAHEVMHCALLHPYRRGARDPKTWNRAADYVINSELIAAGLTLPKDGLIDPQYAGLSAEVVYRMLEQSQDPQDGAQGDQDEPSTGSVQDAPQDAPGQAQDGAQDAQGAGSEPYKMQESDWQIAAEQASDVARMAGKLPGSAAELVSAARKESANWKEILKEFITQTVPSDYSWMNPNKRFVSAGIYLPGTVRENLGKIAVAVDTSGSIDERLLAAFCSELNAVTQDARAESVKVIYCDSQVHKVQEFGQDEPVELDAIGRGGTAFTPVFTEIETWDELPACLIYFTDLECWDTPKAPDYPVLWATDLAIRKEGPFGQTIRITAE